MRTFLDRKNPRAVRLVSLSSSGHRHSYDDVLQKVFAERGMTLSIGTKGGADFFPMLDDNVIRFALTAVRNSLIGRRTVGLFFRPGEALRRDRFRYWLKYGVFRALICVPRTSIITIIPFYIEPRFEKVAHNWIYDLQFWDLHYCDAAHRRNDEIVREVKDVAQGRRVLVALGAQSEDKGFKHLVQLYSSSQSLRDKFLFVAAGLVSDECKKDAAKLTMLGGIVLDRFITDIELMTFYDCSDVIWACYSPAYNQASGVFGRALQFGRKSVVRRASYIHQLGTKLEADILALDPSDNIDHSANTLMEWCRTGESSKLKSTPPEVRSRIADMRNWSSRVLIEAVGVS